MFSTVKSMWELIKLSRLSVISQGHYKMNKFENTNNFNIKKNTSIKLRGSGIRNSMIKST